MIHKVLAEEAHFVNILPAQDVQAGVTSDVFSMKGYSHATIIISCGTTDADAGNITVESCDNFTPTTHTEIAFNYYAEETAAGDTLGARTAKTAAQVIDVSANDNTMYIIEVDAAELLAAGQAFDKLRISWSACGGATTASAVAVLTGARYGMDQSPTAIA